MCQGSPLKFHLRFDSVSPVHSSFEHLKVKSTVYKKKNCRAEGVSSAIFKENQKVSHKFSNYQGEKDLFLK